MIDLVNLAPELFLAQLEAERILRSRQYELLRELREIDGRATAPTSFVSRLHRVVRGAGARFRNADARERAIE